MHDPKGILEEFVHAGTLGRERFRAKDGYLFEKHVDICAVCGCALGFHGMWGCRPLGGMPPVLPRTRGLSSGERFRRAV